MGTVAAPPEIFAHGLSFSPSAGVFGIAELTTFAAQARQRWLAQVAPSTFSECRLTSVKVSLVGADGFVVKTPLGAFTQGEDIGVTTGGVTTAAANGIFQVSLAISTASVVAGATGRGRFYLPYPSVGADGGTGLIPAAAIGAVADRMKLFIDGLNTDAGVLGFGPAVIASAGSVVKNIPPRLNTINAIRVGRRYDVIRARGNALQEGYVVRPL